MELIAVLDKRYNLLANYGEVIKGSDIRHILDSIFSNSYETNLVFRFDGGNISVYKVENTLPNGKRIRV